MATSNLILAQSPAFHLHAGDVSYAENGGDGLLTDDYDPGPGTRTSSQTAASTAAFIPWMVSLGNHEMEPWYSPDGYGADVDRFDFPGNGPSVCPGTYFFTYGNVGIISLDPNDVSYEIPANFGYSGGSQTTWLGQTLQGLRGNPERRLHRRVLPPLRLLHLHDPRHPRAASGSSGLRCSTSTAWISSSTATTTSTSGPTPSRPVHQRRRRPSVRRFNRRPRGRPT